MAANETRHEGRMRLQGELRTAIAEVRAMILEFDQLEEERNRDYGTYKTAHESLQQEVVALRQALADRLTAARGNRTAGNGGGNT